MTRSDASFIVQPERELIRVSFFSFFFFTSERLTTSFFLRGTVLLRLSPE